jgi:hypothetical protein
MTNETTTLTDLPPELLDHISSYLPTAHDVSQLSATSKKLNIFVEKQAWQTFARVSFPSLYPHTSASPGKDIARTLTTLSKAWDRRALVARYIEPQGDIHVFPGSKKTDRWKRPRGQTIGFAPQLDCFEEVGNRWRDRKEVLAFSAGAETCVRIRRFGMGRFNRPSWVTYKPLDASEGRDDITTLHLLKPEEADLEDDHLELIQGTANGALSLVQLATEPGVDPVKKSFTTHGMPVRSSSLCSTAWQPKLLAANMGDTRVCLYHVEGEGDTVEPVSEIDIQRPSNGHRTYRAWSTNFISSTNLAVGLGPSDQAIHIHELSPSGIRKEPLRKFRLLDDTCGLDVEDRAESRHITSSVYPIVPLPASPGSGFGDTTSTFLSGAYDGIVRLHDIRSSREADMAFVDPTDDGAVYSLLPHGQEKLIVGTSRHTLLKVFDMRLGAKAYSYLDASSSSQAVTSSRQGHPYQDWNLFLKPNSATYSGRGGGNNWARRSAESSIYSLASPSLQSPFVFAGVENAVVELALTSVKDRMPDATFFSRVGPDQLKRRLFGSEDKEVLDLAMYDQKNEQLKLMNQRSLSETVKDVGGWKDGKSPPPRGWFIRGLDDRWKYAS